MTAGVFQARDEVGWNSASPQFRDPRRSMDCLTCDWDCGLIESYRRIHCCPRRFLMARQSCQLGIFAHRNEEGGAT